jgi:hypothetical protein
MCTISTRSTYKHAYDTLHKHIHCYVDFPFVIHRHTATPVQAVGAVSHHTSLQQATRRHLTHFMLVHLQFCEPQGRGKTRGARKALLQPVVRPWSITRAEASDGRFADVRGHYLTPDGPAIAWHSGAFCFCGEAIV